MPGPGPLLVGQGATCARKPFHTQRCSGRHVAERALAQAEPGHRFRPSGLRHGGVVVFAALFLLALPAQAKFAAVGRQHLRQPDGVSFSTNQQTNYVYPFWGSERQQQWVAVGTGGNIYSSRTPSNGRSRPVARGTPSTEWHTTPRSGRLVCGCGSLQADLHATPDGRLCVRRQPDDLHEFQRRNVDGAHDTLPYTDTYAYAYPPCLRRICTYAYEYSYDHPT